MQSSSMQKALRIETVFHTCAGLLDRSDFSLPVPTLPFSCQPGLPGALGESKGKSKAQVDPATEKCFLLLHLKFEDSREARPELH